MSLASCTIRPAPPSRFHPLPLGQWLGRPDGSVWTEAFRATGLPQPPQPPLPPRACDLRRLPTSPWLHLHLLPPQVWRRHRKGRPAPSPHDWPPPSAHLPWVLLGLCGNSCFVALGAQDSSPVPPPGPSPRACLLPGALLAFVTEQGTGSQTWGVSLLLGPLCPASRAQLSHSPPPPGGLLYLCSSGRGGSGSPSHAPHLALVPASSPLEGFLRRWFPRSLLPSARGRTSSPKTHCLPQGPPPRRCGGALRAAPPQSATETLLLPRGKDPPEPLTMFTVSGGPSLSTPCGPHVPQPRGRTLPSLLGL